MVVAEHWREDAMELLLLVRVSVLQDEKILWMDGGGDCTAT